MSALLTALHLVLLAQSPAVTVSFDLRGLSEADYRSLDGLGLERKVTLRLIQEGFAVVAFDSGAAQLQLSATRVDEGLRLEAVGPTGRLEQRLRHTSAGSLAELHLEVAQKASELARRLKAQPPAPARAPPPAGLATAPPTRSQGLELGVGGGAVWLGAATAPQLLLSVRGTVGPLGLDVEAGVSTSRGTDLEAHEVQGGVFAGYRLLVLPGVHLEPAVGAGTVVHVFEATDPLASAQAGAHVSPAGWARLKAGAKLTEQLAVDLRLALGAVSPLLHRSEGATLWARGGLRAETGACLTWAP